MQELEYKCKLLETKISMQLPTTTQPHVSEKSVSNVSEKPAFCLKTYMSELQPISIEQFKSNYVPSISDYDNIFTYGITDGLIRNIINYINKHSKKNLPMIISNNQTARFRIYIYQKINDESTSWCKYDGQEGINILIDIVNWLINKYYRNINVFYDKYPTHTNGIQNETNMLKKENLLSSIGKASSYANHISNDSFWSFFGHPLVILWSSFGHPLVILWSSFLVIYHLSL